MLEGSKNSEIQLQFQLLISVDQIFLLFRNLDHNSWIKTLNDSRDAYKSLKEHLLKNIENSEDISAEDPLSDTEAVSCSTSPTLKA